MTRTGTHPARVDVRTAITLLSASILTAACAMTPAPAKATGARHADDSTRVADAVLASGDPDAAWTAALYLSAAPPAEAAHAASADRVAASRAQRASALLARAASELPDDPVPAMLRLRLCAVLAGCDGDALAAESRAQYPAVAIGWLAPLRAALESRDDARIDAALTDLRGAPDWDLHWNATIARATALVRRSAVHMPAADAWHYQDAQQALASVAGLAASVLLPPLQTVSAPCRETAGRALRLESCLAIARAAQRADTVLIQGFGFALEARLLADDSPERAAAANRRRVLQWRVEQAAKLQSRAQAEATLEFAGRMPREEDSMAALLAASGVALEPPDGWTSR